MKYRYLLKLYACGLFMFGCTFALNPAFADMMFDDYSEMPSSQMDMMGMGMGMDMPMMGYGRMGRHRMDFGMMSMLDLSDDQKKKINALHDELRKNNWKKMGEIMELQAKLRDEYQTNKPDPKAVGEIYEKISQIQKSMIEERVATMNKAKEMLSEKQRDQLKSGPAYGWGRGPMMRHGWRYSMDQ